MDTLFGILAAFHSAVCLELVCHLIFFSLLLTKMENQLKSLENQFQPHLENQLESLQKPHESLMQQFSEANTRIEAVGKVIESMQTQQDAEARAGASNPWESESEDAPLPKATKPPDSTITNMENIKRAFFSKEYDTFRELVKQHPFRYYKANYKYSSDNTGRPEYVARNLLRGFVNNLDEYRKYLMVGFRCIRVQSDPENVYKYPSYWIVNSNDTLDKLLGTLYDDFDFIAITDADAVQRMLKKLEKNEDETDTALIGEAYLH